MIIDCTFRDGGYYVNWDFDNELVYKYLKSIELSNIEIIELGFRFISKNKFLGAYAYTTDDHINSLPVPSGKLISILINASDYINFPEGMENGVNKFFNVKSKSPVDIVRVAVHVHDIDNSEKLAKYLFKLGYKLCLNIMQVDALKGEDLKVISKNISKWGCIDVLYFADSFGNMSPESVKDTVKFIQKGWSGKIGFHAHDNKGQALTNCMAAVDCGVEYIDSTILGMGRGAGNAKTENLLIEFKNKNYGNYNPEPLFELAMKNFKLLHEKHQWGTNLYYYLSAIYGIHPTYIQVMLSDKRYSNENIISTINSLKKIKSTSFNPNLLNLPNDEFEGNEKGKWSAKNFCFNKRVLIIGSGKSSFKYLSTIKKFIQKNKLFVLCLNFNNDIPRDIVNAYVACNQTRFLIESDSYLGTTTPLILPLTRMPKSTIKNLSSDKLYDYGLKVQKNTFNVTDHGCVVPKPLAFAYALAVSIAGGAKEILLTGFDGYEASDPKQQEMLEIFKIYKERNFNIPITAITPTNYSIPQGSIFDPYI